MVVTESMEVSVVDVVLKSSVVYVELYVVVEVTSSVEVSVVDVVLKSSVVYVLL